MLRALSLLPFELLETASMDAITYKSFVLLALTLGVRRGKLSALRRGQFVRPAVDWSLVCYTWICRLFLKRPKEDSLQSLI